MEFKDLFREKYRAALYAARANDDAATVEKLNDLVKLFEDQYARKNGDSIIVKAKLDYWKDTFSAYALIAQKYGLADRRLQKLFGLIEDATVPSLNDILKGEAVVPAAPDRPIDPAHNGGVNPAGLMPTDDEITPDPSEAPAKDAEDPSDAPSVGAPEDTPADGVFDEEPTDPKGEPSDYGFVFNPGEPRSLSEFIGQRHVVKPIIKEINIARSEGRKHLDNILLLGNPGLGKTTLIKLIASELGVRFEFLDCAQLNVRNQAERLQRFLMRVAQSNEPVVIAFDEIHLLSNELQSSLLTLLNERVYASPLDKDGKCTRIPIADFTFIAATTDDQDILETIKNRCLRLTFQLTDYSPEDLRLIYKNKVGVKGLTITEDAIDECIPRSRGAIRYVNSIVDDLANATYDDEGRRFTTEINSAIAMSYFGKKGIDAVGLSDKDREILRTLAAADGALGADILSARVGLQTPKYISEYERYLIKIGFVNVTNKGRLITEAGRIHIKKFDGDSAE